MSFFASVAAFNAGELSPKMIGRSDVAQYSKGCRTLRNFLVTPYGSAERRPGTLHVAMAKQQTGVIRLIRFAFSETDAYLIEAGPLYFRFFKNGLPVMNGSTVVEVVTPYTADQLRDLQFVQSADVMTICHPEHPVMELSRTAENTFTFAEKSFEFPPMLDPNTDDDATITPSDVTDDITLTAAKDLFVAGHVGGYFQLTHPRHQNEVSTDFTADGVTASLEVKGYWSFTTHGTWIGTLKIQRSFDGGSTWADFRAFSSDSDKNFVEDGSEDNDDVLYRVALSNYERASSGTHKMCRVLLVNPDFATTGVVRITGVTDAKHAAATVVRKLGGTAATSEWDEGAWSTYRGFPRAVTYFEERMVFGGTKTRPQTIWGSKTAQWDNFLLGTKDDEGFSFTLSSNSVNSILWMTAQQSLVIGTSDSEWTLAAGDSNEPLTSSNFRLRPQAAYGSAGIPGILAGDSILFLQRGRRKIREFVYSWEREGYSSPDLTILADHITESGIVDVAFQQLPDPILYCLRGDGVIVGLTYERDQEVVGWHRHDTDGFFVSIAAIPDGDTTTLYAAVSRDGTLRIERFADNRGASPDRLVFSDAAVVSAQDSAFATVSGLDHLEGLTVAILADGAMQAPRKVVSGSVTLDAPANAAVVGLPFTSELSPMPFDVAAQDGSTASRKKSIAQLRIRFQNSIGGEVRAGDGPWQPILSRDIIDDRFDTAIQLRHDEFSVAFPSAGWLETPVIEIRQRDPLPLNVNSLTAVVEIGR